MNSSSAAGGWRTNPARCEVRREGTIEAEIYSVVCVGYRNTSRILDIWTILSDKTL